MSILSKLRRKSPHRPRLAMFIVLALALLAGCRTPTALPTAISSKPNAQPQPTVIDTDMASDDWLAILYLLQRPDVKVEAITVTGAGEAHCAPGIRNALALVALSGYGTIPVACGRETPLQGNHAFPDSWREGVDGLLGLSLPEGQGVPSSLAAVELLESIIQSSSYKITLLTLGPLTNLAETLQQNPSLIDNIQMIYIMGGAVDVPGNIAGSGVGIDNQVAEWNIYVDPSAANIVFNSGAPVTLVPLDATNYAPVTTGFYKRIRADHETPEATFVFDLYKQNPWLFEAGGYYFWDPLAAAILTDPSLATFEHRNLCVIESEGPESGRTNLDSACPQIRVAVSADGTRFEQVFLDALNVALP